MKNLWWLIVLILVTSCNGVISMADYAIVCPDGFELELAPSDYVVDFGIPDGFGLPPITHQSQPWFKLPGAFFESIQIQPRVVTITAKINGSCADELHTLRYTLFNALRWNRTTDDPPLPAHLRYRRKGNEANLNVYYLSDVTEDIGDDEHQQLIGIKLIAYDPLWYDATSHTAALTVQNSFTVSYIIGKINGIWNDMGNAGTGQVYAIAVSPDGNTVYVGGNFLNWNGIANADYIVKYTVSTDTWSALSTGTDGIVYALAIAANGDVYIAGAFANAGGAVMNGITRWDGTSFHTLTTGVAGGAATVFAVKVAANGDVYIGGDFALAGGIANTLNAARWDGAAWNALGTGIDDRVNDLVIAPNGDVYFIGEFLNANAVAVNYIARWNGTTFVALGTGLSGVGWVLALGKDGTLYAGGVFATAGGVTVNDIGKWNGTVWSALGSGMDDAVYAIAIGDDGTIYAGGAFTSAGGLTIADRVAQWNGSKWSQLDVDLPGAPQVNWIAISGTDLYIGFSTTGTARTSYGATFLPFVGNWRSEPQFNVTGPGTLQWIENIDSGKKMVLNCALVAGETATIDLEAKTFTSDSRGDLFPYATMIPATDFASWALEPDPIAPLGVNTVNLFVTGITPAELNDNSNQLSAWANITGITYLNTGSGGQLWVSIIADGGGFYHVALYDDAARTHLVGHTATYNGVGAKAIVADNGSGLGGTVTVDAVVGADADIIVYFCTARIEWTDKFLTADAATE